MLLAKCNIQCRCSSVSEHSCLVDMFNASCYTVGALWQCLGQLLAGQSSVALCMHLACMHNTSVIQWNVNCCIMPQQN